MLFSGQIHRFSEADLTPTWGRLEGDRGPTSSRLPPPTRHSNPRPLPPELVHVDEPGQERLAFFRRGVVKQFVNERLAASAPMHQQVFQFLQPLEMDFELRVPPPGPSPDGRGG